MVFELFGAAPSPGTFEASVEECAQKLVEPEAQIKQAIVEAEVAHFDETGLHVDGKRHWLHVASTPELTHYTAHPKRGKAATDAADILPQFKGRAIHDGWSTYFSYDQCAHGLCNAHHLRELTFQEEREGQPWARKLKDLLLEMKGEVEEAQAAGQTELAAPTLRGFEERYGQTLEEGFALNPPPMDPRPPGKRGRIKQSKARNLLGRLRDHRESVLAFLYDFRVPFENSQAERDLRMMKVKEKVSGCFRSDHGSTSFCRIRGYLSTLRKQGHPMLAALARAFKGAPLTPTLGAE